MDNRLISAMSVACALIISTTASAQSPAMSPVPTPPEVQAQIDIVAKKLCKGEPVIGTRLAAKRKCDTPAQLVHYQRQAREMIENLRRGPCMAGAETGEGQAMQC
jgi:hypothetical protein